MHSINLIPNKNGGLVDQFLSWALTIGRLLIILVETLALSVFLYRFSIDRKIIDLNDAIKNQSLYVGQFNNTEVTSRNLHARLALAKEKEAETDITTLLFSQIIEMGRGQVSFKNLIVTEKSIKIVIQAQQSNRLNSFITKLKTHPEVHSVSIDSIENKISNATIIANITVALKRAVIEDQALEDMSIEPININP